MTELQAFLVMLQRAGVTHTAEPIPYYERQTAVRITGATGFVGVKPEFFFDESGRLGVPNLSGGRTTVMMWSTQKE